MEYLNPSNPRYAFQIFAKLLDSKTAVLSFPGPEVTGGELYGKVSGITGIPIPSLRLTSNGSQLNQESQLTVPEASVHVTLRLRGGKGGFGSLLRGAATKAGQKKTNNFDACRDMSGRRLRHVNAEKRLEEWKAEEEERRLERIAEDFIKKKAKKGKKGTGDGAAEKYVEKYREQSALCAKEVEDAVREACSVGDRKRKLRVVDTNTKRLKIWMGKRKVGESDSEDDDEDVEENEKSIVLNSANHSDSNKVDEGSSNSVTGGGALCESGASEEEKEAVTDQDLKFSSCDDIVSTKECMMSNQTISNHTVADIAGIACDDVVEDTRAEPFESEQEENVGPDSQPLVLPTSGVENAFGQIPVSEANALPVLNEETAVASSGGDKPIDFDEINSAAELENLGMERLKTELQVRGLKCGGALHERAARLFLLKSTPLDKLPKKLLAKK